MGTHLTPEVKCPNCGHKGTDYKITPKGELPNGEPLHLQCNCGKCGQYIMYMPKADKYGTKAQQREIWQKTNGRCCYCGFGLNPFDKNGYTYEHIDPQSKGGGHDTENLYPCCKHCNSQKGGKELEEYRAYMMEEMQLPKWVFYFEVMMYTRLGDIMRTLYF